MKCFIIAEAGVNHNGSLDLAIKLIEAAANAGADAVKFQSFKAESLVCPGTETAAYQKQNCGDTDQFKMLKSLELDFSYYQPITEHCRKLGIEFMSTPFDEDAADFLVDNFKMKRIKVPSGELTNWPFIRHLARKNKPIILSTGMSTLEEVRETVQLIQSEWKNIPYFINNENNLTLLHCTSNYPTQYTDVNLRAMRTLAETFNIPIGYSDHTLGTFVGPLAVAMGATVIEKHFTLDRNLPGPDHAASLLPEELSELVKSIRLAESCLGSAEKKPTLSEINVRDLVRRSLVLNSVIKQGETLTKENIVLRRPGTGIASKEFDKVLGKKINKDLPSGHILKWTDILAEGL